MRKNVKKFLSMSKLEIKLQYLVKGKNSSIIVLLKIMTFVRMMPLFIQKGQEQI